MYNSLFSRKMLFAFIAQILAVFGQLSFSLIALLHSDVVFAETVVKEIIFAVLLSTISRLGVDNFFVSKFRGKPIATQCRALVFAKVFSFLSLIIVAFLLELSTIVSLGEGLSPFVFLLAFALNANTFAAQFLVLRERQAMAIILRGNAVFISAGVALTFSSDTSHVLMWSTLTCFATLAYVIMRFRPFEHLPNKRIIVTRFSRWIFSYCFEARSGIVFGILSAAWQNWIYLLAAFDILAVDERLANLLQRILNGVYALTYTVFLVDPFSIPRRQTIIATIVVCFLLLFAMMIIKPMELSVWSVLAVGLMLGLFEFGRIAAAEQRNYTLLSTQALLLLATTALLSGGGQHYATAVAVGILASLLIEALSKRLPRHA